jgi:hypothetical protein
MSALKDNKPKVTSGMRDLRFCKNSFKPCKTKVVAFLMLSKPLK